MNTAEFFGFAAAFLSTVAFLPQVIKTWQIKKAEDVSYALLVTFSSGCFCWVIYGLKTHSRPVLIANLLTLSLNLIILTMKFAFEKTDWFLEKTN